MSTYFRDLINLSDKSIAAIRASMPDVAYYPIQEVGSIHASELALSGGVRAVRDRAGNLCIAKGVRIMKKTGGDAVNSADAGTSTTTSTTTTSTTTTTAAPQTDVTSGSLIVHLLGDYSSGGYKKYTRYDFDAGDKEGFLFDEIRDDGTTISLEDVKILL